MGQPQRTILALVLVAAGILVCGYAIYLEYASLPGEHTLRQASKRMSLAFGGVTLLVLGSWLLR